VLRVWSPPEIERIRIISGLLKLRRDGHFAELYADGALLRVRWEPHGPIQILGWKSAARMVGQANNVAAFEARNGRAPEPLPAGRELAACKAKTKRAGA
jgi:hypothetical protein